MIAAWEGCGYGPAGPYRGSRWPRCPGITEQPKVDSQRGSASTTDTERPGHRAPRLHGPAEVSRSSGFRDRHRRAGPPASGTGTGEPVLRLQESLVAASVRA